MKAEWSATLEACATSLDIQFKNLEAGKDKTLLLGAAASLREIREHLKTGPFQKIMGECYANSVRHGFWPAGETRNKGEMIALMHSELSEMLEAIRRPGMDEHCPEFSGEEIEAADLLIRLFDYCFGHGLRLEEAVKAKMAFNVLRPMKHGKAF